MESQAPRVTVEGFDGPLDLLLELVEEKKVDILTVRLGDLADAYLARVRAMAALPADEVSAFLALASRLVLLKARSLLPRAERSSCLHGAARWTRSRRPGRAFSRSLSVNAKRTSSPQASATPWSSAPPRSKRSSRRRSG